jgi:hypothetical protein
MKRGILLDEIFVDAILGFLNASCTSKEFLFVIEAFQALSDSLNLVQNRNALLFYSCNLWFYSLGSLGFIQ